MHIAAAQLFSRDDFAGGRFHQRRATEKNRSLIFDDDRFIAHRRYVRATRRAGTHHACDLRDAFCAQVGLVVEDAAEVFFIREDFVLQGQKRAAGIDQINAGQIVLQRDFLRAQMLFHRHWVVGAALDGRVIGDDHALGTLNAANAGDDAGGRCIIAVFAIHGPGGEGREFEKWRTGIEQRFHAVARQQLSTRNMPGIGFLAATLGHLRSVRMQFRDDCAHLFGIGGEGGGGGIEAGFYGGHGN